MIEPYEIYLSPKVAEVLAASVALARAHQVMTIFYQAHSALDGTNNVMLTFGDDTRTINHPGEDVLTALVVTGMVIRSDDGYRIFLTKQALTWFEYTNKGSVGRFVYRGWRMGKFWTGALWGAAFGFVVALLSLSQAILQIIQLLHSLGYLSKPPFLP